MLKTTDKTITATEFKAKCLRLLEQVSAEGMVITKRGRPIARIMPATGKSNADVIGSLKGRIVVNGDLFSTGVKWRAQP